jgi:hypothetical protein
VQDCHDGATAPSFGDQPRPLFRAIGQVIEEAIYRHERRCHTAKKGTNQ